MFGDKMMKGPVKRNRNSWSSYLNVCIFVFWNIWTLLTLILVF